MWNFKRDIFRSESSVSPILYNYCMNFGVDCVEACSGGGGGLLMPVTMSNSSDDLTGPDACVNQSGLEITRYHDGETVDPIVGNTIYIDSSGATPFNGNAYFWKFDSDGVGFSSMKISTLGEIIEIHVCDDTPTFRAWHFSSPGRNSSSLACDNTTFTNTFYSEFVGGTLPAMGSTMYLNSSLSTPVGGGDLWFNLQEAFADIPTSYQINSSGQLIDFANC